MDYDKIIDLSSLTLDDCMFLMSKGMRVVINDGIVINIEKED